MLVSRQKVGKRMETSYKLADYGIFTEQSDIRAHVGPKAKTIYVYQTSAMREFVELNKYATKPAYQPGYSLPTASGYCVPIAEAPFIRRLQFESYDWSGFPPSDAGTSEKGAAAVNVVCELLRRGRFPLWILSASESNDRSIQISGTDIVVVGKHKIQVKCDYLAAPKELGGSGNLYIQIKERNPFGLH